MSALNTVPNGKAPKNPFDLGNFETFHQKGGQLNVVGVRETMPNSDYRLSVDAFTRTQLCNTANFARMKENYYFVFVPFGLVCSNAYQMLVQRKQPYSARDFGTTQFPYFSLKAVLKRCLEIAHLDLTQTANAKFRDVHGFNIGLGAFKLLDMLGYGCYLDIVESTFKSSQALSVDQAKAIFDTIQYQPNALAIGAYQMIWYYFFRNEIYDNNVTANIFNFDDVISAAPGQEPISNYNILAVRDIDDFIIDCLQLRYVPYKNDVFMGAMPGTQYGAVSTVSLTQTIPLTISGSAFLSGTTGADGHHLYKIVDDDLVVVPNSDYIDTSIIQETGNPIFGGNPLDTLQTQNESGFFKRVYGNSVDNPGYFVPSQDKNGNDLYDMHNHTLSGSATLSSSGSISSGTSLFDVLQLVEAQAIQKWRQKSMLAGNKTADQFRAHHGEVPRHLIDHIPDFIGSVDNVIQVTEITSQADTASAADESNLVIRCTVTTTTDFTKV